MRVDLHLGIELDQEWRPLLRDCISLYDIRVLIERNLHCPAVVVVEYTVLSYR